MATINAGGSRYGSTSPTATDSRQNSSGSSSGSSTSSSSSTGSTSSSSTSTTKNLSSANEGVLNDLIKQLMSGGTPDMKQQQAARAGETQQVQGIREGYSKENAFGDAQGLIAQQMRKALESMLPSINRAAEDAGSSGGALRALLLQDAATKAAESSSALGVQTAVQYGGIASNLSQVLEQLTRSDPTIANALIGALGVAKGANSTTTTNTTGNTTNNVNQVGTTQGTENKNTNTDYAPFAVAGGNSTAPIYYGPSQGAPAGSGVGSTADFLNQLYGQASNPWSGYTI